MGTFSGIGWELMARKRILPVIIVIAMSRRMPIMLETADSRALFFMAGSDPDLRRDLCEYSTILPPYGLQYYESLM
jgi:hypothetical protein